MSWSCVALDKVTTDIEHHVFPLQYVFLCSPSDFLVVFYGLSAVENVCCTMEVQVESQESEFVTGAYLLHLYKKHSCLQQTLRQYQMKIKSTCGVWLLYWFLSM